MKRILYPILGIAILIISVVQVKAMRQSREPNVAAQQQQRAVSAAPRVSAEGRLVAYPGSEVIVGSEVSGTIERMNVQEMDVVHKGDVLAIIRADDTRAALSQARARVGEADADIRLFEVERDRARKLFEQEVGSRQTWDKAERDLDAARARRASALDEVRRLDATLAKTVITAPIDGTVITRSVQPGESVISGSPIATVANLDRTRVEAEVDEFDSARVKVGDIVDVTAEGYDRRWQGKIEEVPNAVVSRRLKPQDPSKPVDTRVLLVKVSMMEATPLKLGQRVDVEIGK